MNTLRAKIALLLVVAIVSVVGILTWVMIALLGPPPPQRTTEPLAEQVEMFLRVAAKDASALTLVPEPAGGDPRENATERLRAEVSQHRCAVRARQDAREVQHLDSVQHDSALQVVIGGHAHLRCAIAGDRIDARLHLGQR